MALCHVNIGSCLGDRISVIESAVALIEHLSGCAVIDGGTVETPPWGYHSSASYANRGIAFEWGGTALEAFEMLREAQRAIDPSPHRDVNGNYIDRRLDIDMIALGHEVVLMPELELPHPRMHLRNFVLAPMAEIEPHWLHPLLGLTAHELLTAVAGSSQAGELRWLARPCQPRS